MRSISWHLGATTRCVMRRSWRFVALALCAGLVAGCSAAVCPGGTIARGDKCVAGQKPAQVAARRVGPMTGVGF